MWIAPVFLLFISPVEAAKDLGLAGYSADTIGIEGVPPPDYFSVKGLGITHILLSPADHAPAGKEASQLDGGEIAKIAEATEQELDQIKERELKAIVDISGFDQRSLILLVNALKSHPSIAIWKIADCPDAKGISPDTVKSIAEFLRLTDSLKRPTFAVVSDRTYAPENALYPKIHGKAYNAYKNTVDILGIQQTASGKELEAYLGKYVTADLREEQWWAVTPINHSPELLKKNLRCFFEAGAHGVIYFSDKGGFSAYTWLREQTRLQENLKIFHGQLKTFEAPAASVSPAPTQMEIPPSTGETNAIPGSFRPQNSGSPSLPGISPAQNTGPSPAEIEQQKKWMEQMQKQQQQNPTGQ